MNMFLIFFLQICIFDVCGWPTSDRLNVVVAFIFLLEHDVAILDVFKFNSVYVKIK